MTDFNYTQFYNDNIKIYLDNYYFRDALLKSANLFIYNNLPINKYKLEEVLQMNGLTGFYFDEEKEILYPVYGGMSDNIDDNGYGTTFYGATPNRSVTYIDTDGVVGYNNSMRLPRFKLFKRYADMMSEIDISLKTGIIFSRNINIPIVSSESEKQQLEKVFDSLLKGEIEIFSSDNILRQKLNGEIQYLQLTDPNTANKLQSLTMLRDELVREYWLESGCSISSKNKTAQTTTDEIHDMDAVALNIIDDMLQCRQEMIDKLNAKYGFNATVELADCVKESQSDTIKNEEMENNENEEDENVNSD